MPNSKADTHLTNDSETAFAKRARLNQQQLIFNARFWRCYRLLHFIACRVLGGSERAEEAIGSCWRKASRHPQRFEYEGEFRSWLLRVLIDEALVLLRESMPSPTLKALCEPVPAQAFRSDNISKGKGDIRTDDQGRLLTRLLHGSGIVGQKRHLEEGTNLK